MADHNNDSILLAVGKVQGLVEGQGTTLNRVETYLGDLTKKVSDISNDHAVIKNKVTELEDDVKTINKDVTLLKNRNTEIDGGFKVVKAIPYLIGIIPASFFTWMVTQHFDKSPNVESVKTEIIHKKG